MTADSFLPISKILDSAPAVAGTRQIGRSRQRRPISGHLLGRGPIAVSLIAGCHADEPVGPEMLRRLAAFLGDQPADHPLLTTLTWYLVPDANPDGAAVNAAWTEVTRPALDSVGVSDRGYDLASYLRHVVRELPGDDVEFGFPRDDDDLQARPENRAIAAFLAGGAPFSLHGSFHGMAFAPGPWFLIERSWIDRTGPLRETLRRRVAEIGYAVFDVDRGGEKGFSRIDEGFSTRPDSRAMITFFEQRGEPETAALFRPSSMELVRRMSGDPFTFVSEMPLFLRPEIADPGEGGENAPPSNIGTANRRHFHDWLSRLVAERDADEAIAEAARHGIRPMPIRDQMRLQLELLGTALAAVTGPRSGRILATLLIGLATVLAGACGEGPQPSDAPEKVGLRGPRPVVLITLDTTRADYLEPYGATDVETPNLGALAENGVVFENAFAVTPSTLPSHATLLTGLYPPQHGVRNNETHRLRADVPTLAERLHDAGYRTAAFVSAAVLDRRYGLDRGFEHFDDRLEHRGTGPLRSVRERTAGPTVDAARLWLDGLAAGELFFVWIHLSDPHSPYAPPPPFAERYTDNPYAGEIAYMDAEIGRLRQHPILQPDIGPAPAAIVVVGDHGEALGDHGEETHGLLLYDSTLRIPWIAWIPGGPSGHRVEWAVSQIDLKPTVLDLVGLGGSSQVLDLPGRSLLETFPGELSAEAQLSSTGQLHGRYLYSESHVAFHLYGWAKLESQRRARYKYIEAPLPELYDIAADPGELENLVVAEPRVAGLLATSIESLTSDAETSGSDRPSLGTGLLAQSRTLGYLSLGVGRKETDDPGFRYDPKEMMAIHQAVDLARRLLAENRLDESLAELTRILELDPRNVLALLYRGQCLWSLGRHDSAVATLERALQIEPENPLVVLRLAHYKARRGQPTRALELLDAALAIDPQLLEAKLEKARLLELLGRRDEARLLIVAAQRETPFEPWVSLRYAQLVELPDGDLSAAAARLRALVELEPRLTEAWWLLAEALHLEGRDQQALAVAREGLGWLPDDPRLHSHLALGLAAVDDPGAEAALREAIRLSPFDNPRLLNALAAWLATHRRGDESQAIYEQSAATAPRSTEERNDRAMALYQLDRHDEAMTAWRELADEHPEFAPAHTNLAAASLVRRDWRNAERRARLAVEIDPQLATAWSTLGEALLEQGRREESVTALQRAFDLDPADWRSAIAAGQQLARSRRFAEAATAYEVVLRQLPDQADAHYELGLLFSGSLDDPERARFHLLAGLAAQPDHPRSELARHFLRGD